MEAMMKMSGGRTSIWGVHPSCVIEMGRSTGYCNATASRLRSKSLIALACSDKPTERAKGVFMSDDHHAHLLEIPKSQLTLQSKTWLTVLEINA